MRQAWGIPLLIGIAALDAAFGLLTIWDKQDWAPPPVGC